MYTDAELSQMPVQVSILFLLISYLDALTQSLILIIFFLISSPKERVAALKAQVKLLNMQMKELRDDEKKSTEEITSLKKDLVNRHHYFYFK